jgi:hypothetical protein
MFGFAITSFTYLLSFLFKTPSGAQIACILLNFIVGVGLSSVGFALRLGSNTRSAYLNVLRYIFCLLPALGDGLLTWVCEICIRSQNAAAVTHISHLTGKFRVLTSAS